MSRDLLRRLQRLEADRSSAVKGRLVTMFATGETRAEQDAEIDAFRLEEGLTDRDTLVVFEFTTLDDPSTDDLIKVRTRP